MICFAAAPPQIVLAPVALLALACLPQARPDAWLQSVPEVRGVRRLWVR